MDDGRLDYAVFYDVNIFAASTREVVLGTTGGQLYETWVDEKDKKEKYLKLLFELSDRKEPLVGVQMETVGTGPSIRYFVMAATLTRLYMFVGRGSIEEVETSLLRFLDAKFGRGRPGRPDIFYNLEYALCLSLEEKRIRYCVYIHNMMGMHEECCPSIAGGLRFGQE